MDPLRVSPARTRLAELSVVLPCYDEAANAARVVTAAHTVAASLAERFEVVVVDDGSRDGTADAVRALALPEVVIVQHRRNRGYGAALRSGLGAARFEWVFYTDGDGQFDLQQLDHFLSHRENGVVLAGYRSPRADGSWLRSLNGAGWTALTNAALDLRVRDVNCAFKLFPRELLRQVPLSSRGAAIDAEILAGARRLGVPVRQVPVQHRARTGGTATGARPAVIARALLELAQLYAQTRFRPDRLAS